MADVSIVTGGAGGMGLAVAKLLAKNHCVIICDINKNKLEHGLSLLKKINENVYGIECDITDSASVDRLFKNALEMGNLVSVVHTAGISPQMADAKEIMRVNTLGTINITESALDSAQLNFVLVNVASMAGYMLPNLLVPTRAYRRAFTNAEAFLQKAQLMCHFIPIEFYRRGLAYCISKNFVIWYSKKNAARFGPKGARIVSVSPGSFDTEMGRLEEKSGSAEMLKSAALKRFGRPDEIAELLLFCASEKASYLTGVDILCDGGVIASKV